ncbi:hypothetical protein ACQCLI_22315 [Pseudomonas nitroreducens]|uniref:hypothetical protein n=1 Tax=Pseudomonas TaxID=286 RepID=UPI0003693F12|nr:MULTISPECIES: hypothetical protein [Pseudomonas]MDU4256083.1 hypothetical protein [Pseudomonas sp.]
MAIQLIPNAHDKIRNLKLSAEPVQQEIHALSQWIDLQAPGVVPEVTKEKVGSLAKLASQIDKLLLELEQPG